MRPAAIGPVAIALTWPFVNRAPSRAPTASVTWSAGVSTVTCALRSWKSPPATAAIANCPPLKPPRDTSNDDVVTRVLTTASRGMSPPSKRIPFSVTLFWSDDRPSTENPGGPPSAPGTSCTPGTDAAIAARFPWSFAATAPGAWSTLRSAAARSAGSPFGSRGGLRRRCSVTRTTPSCTAEGFSVTSTTVGLPSPARFTVRRAGAMPNASTVTA